MTKQYVAVYKDPYLMDPPNWYKVFVFSELGLQLPFFFVATIAFMLGRYYCVVKNHMSWTTTTAVWEIQLHWKRFRRGMCAIIIKL